MQYVAVTLNSKPILKICKMNGPSCAVDSTVSSMLIPKPPASSPTRSQAELIALMRISQEHPPRGPSI
eukprot:5546212-Prymnesium_polylepis.1